MYEDVELPIWEKHYPKGRNILDIGCYNDTPYFFLRRGAERVLAIDKEHFTFSDPRITFVQFNIDAIKVDIEGAEKGMVIETHYPNPHLTLLHTFSNGVMLWRLE